MSALFPGVEPSTVLKGKQFVARTGLVALGAAFEMLSVHSEEMRQEIEDWEEGTVYSLGILPQGPEIAVRKAHGKIEYLGQGAHGASVRLLFKSIDGALLVLTGLQAVHVAASERRAVVVHGPVDLAVQFNRGIMLVIKFLFPAVMLKGLTKRMPEFSKRDLRTKARLYATIGPSLIGKLSR